MSKYDSILRKFAAPTKTMDDLWPGKPEKYLVTVTPEEVELIRTAIEQAMSDKNLHVPRKDTIDEEYESFWKEIVETDGILDLEKVKAELYDYSFVMREVGRVYSHVTGGLLSKIMYYANTVISEADDHYEEMHRENVDDQLETIQEALEYANENLSEVDGKDDITKEAIDMIKKLRGIYE